MMATIVLAGVEDETRVSFAPFRTPIQMRADIRQMWLDALRSGVLDQAQGTLRVTNSDSFCCLGVLCDVHNHTSKQKNKLEWINGGIYRSTYGPDTDALPPDQVIRWAFVAAPGITRADVDYGFLKTTYTYPDTIRGEVSRFINVLAQLNDTRKWSFKKIANFIEQNTVGV